RFRPTDDRMVDRSFPRRGPRLFVLGESAVLGLGFSENASFPRALERRLRAAGSSLPVVNLGVPQIASRQVAWLERELLALLAREGGARGDVIVLHVGNNELCERDAERRLEARGGAGLLPRLLGSLALAGALRAATHGALDAGEPAARGPLEPVALSDEEVAAVVSEHVAHVRGMAELARAAGATPVLMTVATNLETPLGEGVAEGPLVARWREDFERGQALRRAGDLAGAR